VRWQSGDMTESLASRALSALLDYLPRSYTEGSHLDVLDSWTEGDSVVCVVYQFHGWDAVIGYRQHVELDDELPTLEDWVEEVANFNIGEPLGTIARHMWLDDEGVHWWGALPVPGRDGRWVDLIGDEEPDEPEPGGWKGLRLGPPRT
jgi:hypothetical protein